MHVPIRTFPPMQGGGGGSPDAVDAAGEDVGASDGAAEAVPSVCSLDDVDAAGDSDEDAGDAAGGPPPWHAPRNDAPTINGASRHASEQAHGDQERIRLMG
jgi:hypothetical protein